MLKHNSILLSKFNPDNLHLYQPVAKADHQLMK